MTAVPSNRIQSGNQKPVNATGLYVFYWMVATRRTGWNFGLQRAVEWAFELRKPLLVLETLRCDPPWRCDRFHQFVLEGMAQNSSRFRDHSVSYYPYVEPEKGAGEGLLEELAIRACLIVADYCPIRGLSGMTSAAAQQSMVRCELVDSNGLLPLSLANRAFERAYSFRRFLQKQLPECLRAFPSADPLKGVQLERLSEIPDQIALRWPEFRNDATKVDLSALPIDHSVRSVSMTGGARAAQTRLREFLNSKLDDYSRSGRQPGAATTSHLSAFLHFGHIAAHQIFAELMAREEWSPGRLTAEARGQRQGWWGVSESAESFLDQLITWRELGFNMCHFRDDYDRYSSLPHWALETLANHEQDQREHVYTLAQFETAQTHDPLWNAAQRQLIREGRIHGYLRMLWGKKILEWSPSPQTALEIMIELNNKYALDGRDPNSYSGIFWVLGRYDRPWGPERPVFGKVRYMSSANTARKLRLKEYLSRYAK